MIKTIILAQPKYTAYIPHTVGHATITRFTKYIAENGNAVCTINDEIVEPNAGNDLYRKLKADGAVLYKRMVTDAGDDKIIEIIEDGIDRYIEYIDNYKQYAEAKESNDRLYKLASEFERIAKA